MEKFLSKYYKSFFCFFGIIILFILLLHVNNDYVSLKYLSNVTVDELESVEGYVSKIKKSKSYKIYVNDVELFTNIKLDIAKDDYVIIYYHLDKIRDHNEIVEVINGNETIYSLNDYINDNNYQVSYYICIGLASIMSVLFVVGLILFKFPAPYYKENVEEYILKYAKKYNMSDDNVELVKQQLIPYYNKKEINEEDLIVKFEKSLYKKNNKYFTNAMEYIESSEYDDVFKKLLFNILDNNEVRLIYDDCLLDHSACFFVYKLNDKLLSIYMFNEEDGKFLIDNTCLYFNFPKEVKMNNKEKEIFNNDLKDYLLYNDDIKVLWK